MGRDCLSPIGGELERGQESPLAAPEPGVEEVPEGVAEHVEAVDDQGQTRAGPEREPGRDFHELPTFLAEQTAPGRDLAREAESEEAQRGLSQKWTMKLLPPMG